MNFDIRLWIEDTKWSNNVQFYFQILLFKVKLLFQTLIKTEEGEIIKSCDKESI